MLIKWLPMVFVFEDVYSYQPVRLMNRYPHDIYVLAKSEDNGIRKIRGCKVSRNGNEMGFAKTEAFRIMRVFKLENDEDWATAQNINRNELRAFNLAENLGQEMDRC